MLIFSAYPSIPIKVIYVRLDGTYTIKSSHVESIKRKQE